MINLFIDIETIQDPLISKEEIDELKEKRGEQYNFLAEYHSILCISIGYVNSEGIPVIKTFKGDEDKIIEEFYSIIKDNILIGFNIVGFDIPFIIKRGFKYNIPVPNSLKQYGKKPWEVTNLVDLYQVYKINSYNSASLDTICRFLGLQSSKEEGIDGSMVQGLHDNGQDEEIYKYCERDVIATIEVYNKFKSLNLI